MGYTALLFCPEEKTARTVTQVLSELEFTVEACIEPFAAVKKLMGQHFDAVVVDCDNEQNATLLFKSARNSASNQTSLAVAVVEGQAGVAKAFRIGANLVLTKPINIEQAKGTLRVARGLLRKAEPGKGAASPAASGVAEAAPTAKAAPSKPVEETKNAEPKVAEKKNAAPVPPAAVFTAQADEVPLVKPTPAWSDAAVASALAEASASAPDDDLLGIEEKPQAESKPKPAPGAPPPGSPILPAEVFATRAEAKPALLGVPQASANSGAASAPAPAREVKEISAPKKPVVNAGDDDVLDTSSNAAQAAVVGSAPSFSYGRASDAQESSGAGKKIFIGVAAAALVAAGLYFGWTHFHGAATEQPLNSKPPISTPAPATTAQPTNPVNAQPAAVKPSAAPVSPTTVTPSTNSSEVSHSSKASEDSSVSGTEAKKSPSSPEPGATAVDAPEEPAPLMVKGGTAPAKKKAAAGDADAPSVIGMAPSDAAPMPTIATTSDAAAFKPTLQTLSISQGVSTGLLIKKVPPTYPPSALRMRIEGKVELLATVSKDGDITHIKVVSGDSQLTKAASDAVYKWKYKPYLLNGEPVEIQTQVTVNFKLPQ